MAKTRAVIFDLDGTIFDHASSVREGLSAVMKKFEIVENFDDVFTRHAELADAYEAQVLDGTLDYRQARELRFAELLTELGVPDAEQHAKAAAKAYVKAYQAAGQLLPGAEQALTELRKRGLKLGILSNFVKDGQQLKIDAFKLDRKVDAVLFLDDIPAPKPDVRAFHAACEALGVEPKSALMVGDTIRVDVSGALDAGLKAVWFSPARRDLVLAREVATISRLEQVLDHL